MRSFYRGILVCTAAVSSLMAEETKDPWKGDEYAKHSESQKSSAEDFLGGINLHNATSILDVGCGDGKITAALARAVPQGKVVGIDISSSMIQFAQEGIFRLSESRIFCPGRSPPRFSIVRSHHFIYRDAMGSGAAARPRRICKSSKTRRQVVYSNAGSTSRPYGTGFT